MKTLPAKCPITPNAAAQAIIDKNFLVYVGVGDEDSHLLPVSCVGIGVAANGTVRHEFGSWSGTTSDVHYFIARDAAAKFFKARKVSKPRTVYFHSPSVSSWVGKISRGVEHEYGNGGHSNTASEAVIGIVKRGIANGAYKTLTRAEFLAAIKKFGLNEDGTKIAPKTNLKAENATLKATLAAAEKEIASLKASLAKNKQKLIDFAASF